MPRAHRIPFYPHMHRRRGMSETADPDDPNGRYIRLNMVQWELRRLEKRGRIHLGDLNYLSYLLNVSHNELLELLGMDWGPDLDDEDEECDEECDEERDHMDRASWLQWRRHRQSMRPRREQLEAAFPLCLAALKKRRKALRQRRRPEITRNMTRLAKLFGLSKAEASVALLLYAASVDGRLGGIFEESTGWQRRPGAEFLATALGIERAEASRIVRDRLPALGMNDPREHDHGVLRLSDEMLDLVENPDPAQIGKGMFRRPPREKVPLSAHAVDPADLACLQSLLRCPPAENGTHVLLYGPPGTGKTTFARALGQGLDAPVFEVALHADNKVSSRRLAIMACLNATCGHRSDGGGSVVIVDEADSILNTGGMSMPGFPFPMPVMGEPRDKGWLTMLMDRPGVRMIWIVNNTGGLDPAVERRFAHSVAFRPLGRSQRARIWDQVLRRHGVKRLVNDAEVSRLAGEYDMGVGAIAMAVSKAKDAVGKKGDRATFVSTVRRLLDGHRTLQAGGVRQDSGRERVSDRFTLEGLNVSGDLDKLLRNLVSFDRHLRSGATHDPRQLNLLLSGPPGTGKSELARYLADHVDRPLLVRRASDLFDKYVGETEKRIAAAFQQAEDDEAVLVIDEADSLLFPRDQAVRSWEKSFTNQALSCMERYCGVLVFTTNQDYQGLDSAAIRRFNVKLRMEYLDAHGNEVFYRQLLGELCKASLCAEDRAALRAIRDLAPGDFKTVREQFIFEAPEDVTHTALVMALADEARIKGGDRGRQAGFSR